MHPTEASGLSSRLGRSQIPDRHTVPALTTAHVGDERIPALHVQDRPTSQLRSSVTVTPALEQEDHLTEIVPLLGQLVSARTPSSVARNGLHDAFLDETSEPPRENVSRDPQRSDHVGVPVGSKREHSDDVQRPAITDRVERDAQSINVRFVFRTGISTITLVWHSNHGTWRTS